VSEFDLNKNDLELHLLKTGDVRGSFKYTDDQWADKVTSQIIKHGGVLKARRRDLLDNISPFLVDRMAGHAALKAMEGIKEVFDPKDVLCSNQMFKIRQSKDKGFV
jgi:FAD/FMN-containing dehydrogenase